MALHPKSVRRPTRRPRLQSSRLAALIEEATIDAYTESEQAGGFHAMIEEALDLPFETIVLGVTISVRRIDISKNNEVVAVCYRGRQRQAIPILALPLPDPLATPRPRSARTGG